MKLRNRYDLSEWAGAFGDIGTLIPFVVAYITIIGVDPLGLLLMFGISKVVAGFYYKTPVPIQPMKAIGAAAIAGGISPSMLFASGFTTGIFWFILGITNTIRYITGLASKPVVRGIMLGLGLSFVIEGIERMMTVPVLAGIALIITYPLLRNPKIPAMFVLLILGTISAMVMDPSIFSELSKTHIVFKLPSFQLDWLSLESIIKGTLILTIPQLPLTLGNAIIATAAENNALFPHRTITERNLSLSHGVMNLISPLFGGVPMCHGAGGMAGHVLFGARTGGALVILGSIIILLALFFSESVAIIFKVFPASILGVILFFAGLELAVTARDIGVKKPDFYIMLLVAGFAMWNMGVAFLAGVILDRLLKKGWIKV